MLLLSTLYTIQCLNVKVPMALSLSSAFPPGFPKGTKMPVLRRELLVVSALARHLQIAVFSSQQPPVIQATTIFHPHSYSHPQAAFLLLYGTVTSAARIIFLNVHNFVAHLLKMICLLLCCSSTNSLNQPISLLASLFFEPLKNDLLSFL